MAIEYNELPCCSWIVCGAAFLAHLLSTGLQLAYGALHVYALRHFGPAADHAGKIHHT